MADDGVLATLKRMEEAQKKPMEGRAVEISIMHSSLDLMNIYVARMVAPPNSGDEITTPILELEAERREQLLPQVRVRLGLANS
jgi:hypothetical protein